jgi:hypothetical protein
VKNKIKLNKNLINEDGFNIKSVIGTDILPYEARFLADPFIRKREDDTLYILCEALISSEDKRIVHLQEGDDGQWRWVRDVLKGGNFSFPATYKLEETSDEVIIVPEMGGDNGTDIIGFRYNLVSGDCGEVWRIALGMYTKDRIIVPDTNASKNAILYAGGRIRATSMLYSAEIANFPAKPVLTSPLCPIHNVGPVHLLKRAFKRVLNLSRTTYRPAGDIIKNDAKGVILPLQATTTGEYGKCIAVAHIYSGAMKQIRYIFADEFGKEYTRTHHISLCPTDNRLISCVDVYSPEKEWELIVFESNPSFYNFLCDHRSASEIL